MLEGLMMVELVWWLLAEVLVVSLAVLGTYPFFAVVLACACL